MWPLIAGRRTVTLEFGPGIHPFTNTWYLHKGIDIADAVGVSRDGRRLARPVR